MKKLFCIILFGLSILSAKSQDLIVTSSSDSIQCKITGTDADKLYYRIVMENGQELQTEIPRNLVSNYELKYYNRSVDREFAQLVFSMHGGYSHRTAKTPEHLGPAMEEYVKSLKSGYHFGADLVYYFNDMLGFGVKYSSFRSNGLLEDYSFPTGTGTVETIDMSDEITINFIGPELALRQLSATGRNSLILKAGFGYFTYEDRATIMDYLTLKGNTIGMVLSLGYDMGIGNNFMVGIFASQYVGMISEFEISNGNITETIELEEESYEGLGRLDLSLKLSFRF